MTTWIQLKPSQWTEKHVQLALYQLFNKRRHVMMCPNTKALWINGESDFVSVNQGGLAVEVEVKVTPQDFEAEFRNKVRKHDILSGKEVNLHHNMNKPELMGIKEHHVNYFYFACPDGIIRESQVPDYAGLITMECWIWPSENFIEFRTKIVKEPKKLHKKPLEAPRVEQLKRGVMHRAFKFLDNHLTEKALRNE